jgi:hypothetical protein
MFCGTIAFKLAGEKANKCSRRFNGDDEWHLQKFLRIITKKLSEINLELHEKYSWKLQQLRE